MPQPDWEDEPWSEDQWEAFMTRQDIRSAKFGELLETFMDHPDRDEIIGREMGWIDDEQDEEQDEEDAELIEAMNRAAAEATAELDAMSDEEREALHRERRDELESIPAYARAYKFGLQVHNALKPYMEAVPEPDDPDENLLVAYRDSMVIAAKLARSHGMGYEDRVLCGTIVCCKISMAAADKCLDALHALADSGLVPLELCAPLITEGEAVRDLVAQRIADLRSRVWW